MADELRQGEGEWERWLFYECGCGYEGTHFVACGYHYFTRSGPVEHLASASKVAKDLEAKVLHHASRGNDWRAARAIAKITSLFGDRMALAGGAVVAQPSPAYRNESADAAPLEGAQDAPKDTV